MISLREKISPGLSVTNFNISVAITDRFMQALEKNEDYEKISIESFPNSLDKNNRKSGFDYVLNFGLIQSDLQHY
jgi:hypothetical protein